MEDVGAGLGGHRPEGRPRVVGDLGGGHEGQHGEDWTSFHA